MSILDEIIENKRREITWSQQARSLEELKQMVADLPPVPGNCFSKALTKEKKVSLIAEIKKASPSAGLIRTDFDPQAIAAAYASGGAAALSVLTDKKYFQGDDKYLIQAKVASGLPVLMKDFTVSAYQLYQARLLDADCVLLIAAVLEESLLADLLSLSGELGLEALVEVHDETELERAVRCRAGIIGVNNRDLRTFRISLEVSAGLAPLFPEGAVRVSESGITSREHVRLLGSLGYDAVLVGEHLMRQADLSLAVKTLMNDRNEICA